MTYIKMIFEGKFCQLMIFLSLLPLMTSSHRTSFTIGSFTIPLGIIFFLYFLIQFLFRFKTRKLKGFFLICDLLALISFLPSFAMFRLLLLTRLISAAARVKGMQLLVVIIKENAYIFQSIFIMAFFYMLFTSILVYNVEPETFNNNYLYALYWSGITLTTVGYGDVYPITPLGQLIALISSFLGIGIIALPTGIISSNYIMKIQNSDLNKDNDSKS